MSSASLQSVRVSKNDLLSALEQNKEAHREIFEKAMDGYKAKAIELLEDEIERIKRNAPEKVFVSLLMPEDHTADYMRVIEMLVWSIDEEVWLTQQEFASYVMDDWGWRESFAASTQPYLSR